MRIVIEFSSSTSVFSISFLSVIILYCCHLRSLIRKSQPSINRSFWRIIKNRVRVITEFSSSSLISVFSPSFFIRHTFYIIVIIFSIIDTKIIAFNRSIILENNQKLKVVSRFSSSSLTSVFSTSSFTHRTFYTVVILDH